MPLIRKRRLDMKKNNSLSIIDRCPSIIIYLLVFLLTCCGDGGNGGNRPSGEELNLLEGAYYYNGSYSVPAELTYTDKYGTPVTVQAFPGQIIIFVSEEIPSQKVIDIIQGKGGSILTQVPAVGFYVVEVTPGNEDLFITSLQSSPIFQLVIPNSFSRTRQVLPFNVDLTTDVEGYSNTPLTSAGDVVQFDDLYNPAGGTCADFISHGQAVGSIITDTEQGTPNVIVSQYQVAYHTPPLAPEILGVIPNDRVLSWLARFAQGAAEDNKVKVVNLSLGPEVGYECDECTTDECLRECQHNCSNCATEDCRRACQLCLENNALFLFSLYKLIENMPDSTRKNLAIVIAAGNSGIDLTAQMNFLRNIAPNAMKHIQLVSGTDAVGTPYCRYNYSQNPSDIIYAKSLWVSLDNIIYANCKVNGTSFAAPVVSRLAAQLIKRFPNPGGLSADQVLQVIRDAAHSSSVPITPCSPSGFKTVPTYEEAVAAAQVMLFGPCIYSITPQSTSFDSGGGSGEIYVVTTTSCSWSLLSDSSWITVSSNSSGTGNATITYSVSANTDPIERIGHITVGGQVHTVTQAGTTSDVLEVYSGTASHTGTDQWVNDLNCTPNPYVISYSSSLYNVDLIITEGSLITQGNFKGDITIGSFTETTQFPSKTCCYPDYPSGWHCSTIPSWTAPETYTGWDDSIVGTSDSTSIEFTFEEAEQGCSEQGTGTLTIDLISGDIRFSGNIVTDCVFEGEPMHEVCQFSLIKQ